MKDEYGVHSPNKLSRQPQERLLEVVVRFCRDFEILQVLFSVESHIAGFHFTLLCDRALVRIFNRS